MNEHITTKRFWMSFSAMEILDHTTVWVFRLKIIFLCKFLIHKHVSRLLKMTALRQRQRMNNVWESVWCETFFFHFLCVKIHIICVEMWLSTYSTDKETNYDFVALVEIGCINWIYIKKTDSIDIVNSHWCDVKQSFIWVELISKFIFDQNARKLWWICVTLNLLSN